MSEHPDRQSDNPNPREIWPGWDYSDEEREFLIAIDRYKRTRGRPFPTWREVLNVLRELGWQKVKTDSGKG